MRNYSQKHWHISQLDKPLNIIARQGKKELKMSKAAVEIISVTTPEKQEYGGFKKKVKILLDDNSTIDYTIRRTLKRDLKPFTKGFKIQGFFINDDNTISKHFLTCNIL